MKFRFFPILVMALAVSLGMNGALASKKINKQEIKETCAVAGGSYSEGSNYARCQYANGDSYTCNTDVNQCETCTNGKCTVSIKRPGGMKQLPMPVPKAKAGS